MKALLLSALFAASSAQALPTITCKSYVKPGVVGGARYTVVIKQTGKEIKKATKDYYFGYPVEVTVLSQARPDLRANIIRKGFTMAYSEDVNYRIVSKELGISFYLFLDEYDQAGITLYSPGKKTEVRLTCE